MKKMFVALSFVSMCFVSVYADVQADGANFCADNEFTNPVSYIAIREANTYGDVLVDDYIDQAKIKGHLIKKGTEVKVYAIGKNCNVPKMVFMDINDVGFTGVKLSDFKKLK